MINVQHPQSVEIIKTSVFHYFSFHWVILKWSIHLMSYLFRCQLSVIWNFYFSKWKFGEREKLWNSWTHGWSIKVKIHKVHPNRAELRMEGKGKWWMGKLFTKVLKTRKNFFGVIRTGAKQKFVSNLILKISSTMWQRVSNAKKNVRRSLKQFWVNGNFLNFSSFHLPSRFILIEFHQNFHAQKIFMWVQTFV